MIFYLQELRDSIQLTPSVPRTAIASQSAARSQPGGQARSQLAGPDLRNVETIILENIHLTALSSRCNLLGLLPKFLRVVVFRVFNFIIFCWHLEGQ